MPTLRPSSTANSHGWLKISEIVFPLSTAPGVNPVESGGRLINAYAEKAPVGSRSQIIIRRSPGLRPRFETIAGHRGTLLVGSVLYIVSDDTAYSVTKSGSTYTVTALTGTVPGTGPVIMARNMNSTPQILMTHSAGMSQINTGPATVTDFSDADLPVSNSICFLDGYFIFTIGDGRAFASGLNAITVASTDFARAEADPDGLVRGIARDRDLMLMGVSTTEFWANVGNPTGFPFQRGSVIPVGLAGPYAVAGMEPGFGGTICWVGNDRTVRRLDGYSPTKISEPDLDRLLEAVTDTTTLEASVYVAGGHPCWAVSSGDWTWVYDLSTKTWHERASYGQERWRAHYGVHAFDEWLTFDTATADVFKVDDTYRKEKADPLVWEVRSAQSHAFPSRMTVDRASFDFVTGVGIDAGVSPIETEPVVLISWSDDGGRTFLQPLTRRLGTQGELTTIDVRRCGLTGPRGRQWRLQISDPVTVSLAGGAMDGRIVA